MVRYRTTTFGKTDRAETEISFWYSPSIGALVKGEFKSVRGRAFGRGAEFELTDLIDPSGAQILPLTGIAAREKPLRSTDNQEVPSITLAPTESEVASVPEKPTRPTAVPAKQSKFQDGLVEPAEYKPPQVGTRIEYSNWTCTVEKVDGFRTKCRLDEGGSVTLFGWLEIDGDLPRSGYLANRWFASRDSLLMTALTTDSQRKLENLWPLKNGNQAKYTVRAVEEVRYSGPSSARLQSRALVERAETITIGGTILQAFPIGVDGTYIHLCRVCSDRSPFVRRLWYAPELGIVVKEEFEHDGLRSEYELRSMRLADGSTIFPPNVATPVANDEND